MSEPRTMEQRVTDIIKQIGVPAHLKGYYYVRDAILLVIENDEFLRGVATKLYPLVAEKYHASGSCVERNIRHCLSIACSRGNITFISRLFGPYSAERGITNKRFIEMIAYLLKNPDMLIHEDAKEFEQA